MELFIRIRVLATDCRPIAIGFRTLSPWQAKSDKLEFVEQPAPSPRFSTVNNFVKETYLMNTRKALATILFSVFVGLAVGAEQVTAQSPSTSSSTSSSSNPSQEEKRSDETNLDTQLYLLVATNQDVDDAKLPAALDSVVKQLRASLPYKNYRLTTTLVNRVKNNGRLTLKWIGGPLIASAAASANTPSFNEFKVNSVKLVTDDGGRQVVRMDGFVFGARIPIVTGTTVASNGPAAPIFNYENTGLNTDISIREGEAVVVGTLNVGPSGDAIILVMSAKRANK